MSPLSPDLTNHGLDKYLALTLGSWGCPVAVSTTLRRSRLNMLLSWPVEEGAGA